MLTTRPAVLCLAEPDDIASENLAQLALYRELVRQIYPTREVEAVLLWTRLPQVMEVPANLLDQALVQIKKG